MSEFPYFFEVNKINIDQDTIVASTGDGNVENCFDYNKETYWESIGSDDTTTETIDIIFLTADGQHESRTIDRLILTNTNLKNFKLQKNNWNGSSWDGWVDISGAALTTNSDSTVIVSFTSTSTYRIQLVMYTTIVADEEKIIDEFIATVLLWEATMPMDVFQINNKQQSDMRRLYNGKGQMIHNYDKWGARIEFRQITETELGELKSIYDLHTAFIFIAEPYDNSGNYDKPDELYRVLWQPSWNQQYFTNVKSAGFNVRMAFEEV